ncbi:MAG: LLM class flavin-dependent oxidoreductase [Gaiellaceae bacterium]
MKFGLALPTGMEGLINPIPFFSAEDFVPAAQLAERLGFDSVWGNDHYAPQEYVRSKYREPPNFYEVLTVLAAVSSATTYVELGTAVLVLPMRDIVTLAKQTSTLDQLSGGRLLLGVSIGAYKEEYAAARPDLVGRHRGNMLEEGLEILRRVGTERSVTYEGETYRLDDFEMYPKFARQPFPVLVGGHQLRAIDRAVRLAEGWIPGWRPFEELREWIGVFREKAAEAGRDPQSMIAAPQLSCLVARSHEQAERRYMESGMVQHRLSLAYTGRDPALAMDNNLVGSTQEVLEKVETLHEAGADHLACITLCVDTVDEYHEQMHLLAEEVIRPYRRRHRIPDPGAGIPSREPPVSPIA